MPTYRIEIPGKGTFRIESPTELTDAQVYQAVASQQGFGVEEPPKEEPGVMSQLLGAPKEIVKGAASGLVQAAGGLGALPYAAARYAVPELKPFEETAFGKGVTEAEKYLAPTDEGYITQLASGLGSFASMFGPQALLRGVGTAGRLATGVAPKLATPVALGQTTGLGVEEARQRAAVARAEGQDISAGEELAALAIGVPIGLTELLPIERLFKGLDTGLSEGFKYTIANRVKRALQQGGVEGAQEVASGLMQDLAAKGIYNPNLELGQSMFDELTVGGGVGAIAQTGLDILFKKNIQAAYNRTQAKKAEDEVKKRTEEIYQQQQKQIATTKEQLGIKDQGILALPAPAKEVEAAEQADPLQNPLGMFKQDQLQPGYIQQVNKMREGQGMAKVKDLSIEDIADAGAPQEEIDRLIAGRLSEQGVNVAEGLKAGLTRKDVENLAAQKNIDTNTPGYTDFLRRATGVDADESMSPIQRLAAFNALSKLEASPELQVLPEGTNATRFTQEQYDKSVKSIKDLFPETGRLGRTQVIQEIKDYSGLENDRDAQSLLQAAIRNGDFDTESTRNFLTLDEKGNQVGIAYTTRKAAERAAKARGLSVKERTSIDILPPRAEQPLPGGPDIRQGTFEEGQAPAGYEIRSGQAVLATANTEEEANAKAERLQRLRQNKADATRGQIESIEVNIAKSQQKLEALEADGKANTIEYQQLSAKIDANNQNLRNQQARLNKQVEDYSQPLSVTPKGVKPVTRTGYTLFEQGKPKATFPTQQAAEEAALVGLETEQLQALVNLAPTQKGLQAKRLGKMARDELARRLGGEAPAGIKIKPTEGRTVKETEERLADLGIFTPEFKKKATELEQKLRPMLDKLGLKSLRLNIVRAIQTPMGEADGSYAERLVTIALNADNPIRTLRHEAIHALKELGAFTDAQWKVLEKMAKEQWLGKYEIVKRYKDIGLTQSEMIEEAIADAFSDFDQTKPPAGLVGTLFRNIKSFFTALGNAMQGMGFQTADDVFAKVEKGIKLPEGATIRPATERYSLALPKAKVDRFFKDAEDIDMPEGVEIIRDNWIGGVAGIGDRDGAYDLPYVEGGKDYMKEVQDLVRRDLGDSFKGYRLMSKEEFEEIQSTAMGTQLASFTLDPMVGLRFSSLPMYARRPKGDLVVVEMDLTPEHIKMIGHLPEREVVVDYGQGYNPEEVIAYASPISPAPISKEKFALKEDRKARSMADLEKAIPVKDRVVSKDPTKLLDGKPFSQGPLSDRGIGFIPYEDDPENAESLIQDLWQQSIEESGGDYVRTLVNDLEAAPPTAEFFNDALKLPEGNRYWYELSGETVNDLPLPNKIKDTFLDVISATSLLTKPLDNAKRSVSVMSEFLQKKPIETDLISLKPVMDALQKPDLETLKFGNFAGTMKFVSGISKKAPITTNDRQIAVAFNMEPDDFAKNPVMYEVVSRFYNKLRDVQNSMLPEGSQPYEAWQLQALTWVEQRGDNTSYDVKTSDDYQQAIAAITEVFKERGLPLVDGKISMVTLLDPRVPKILSGTIEQFQNALKGTLESNTLLNSEGAKANEAYDKIKDIDEPWARNLRKEFNQIQRRVFTSLSGERVIQDVISAVLGRRVQISRIDTTARGTYEGKLSPNMRIPMTVKLSGNMPYTLTDQEAKTVLSILSEPLDQAAAAGSLFKPVSGAGDTFRVFFPNKTISDKEATDFEAAIGYPLNVYETPNGGVVEINIGGFDTRPELNEVKIAVEDVFGDIEAKAIPSSYNSVYITKDETGWSETYKGVINGFRADKFGRGDPTGGRRRFDDNVKESVKRIRDIAKTRNNQFKKFTKEADERLSKYRYGIIKSGAKEIYKRQGIKPTKFALRSGTGSGIVLGEKQPGAVSAIGVHYGKEPNVNSLSGSRYGSGIKGAEARRLAESRDPRIKKRVYFYLTEEGQPLPRAEQGLGNNLYTQRFDNILTQGDEMQRIYESADKDMNAFESAVVDEGYDGYAIPSMGMMVVLNHNVPVNYQGLKQDVDPAKIKYSLKAPDTKEFRDWFGDSKVVDENGEPMVVYHGTPFFEGYIFKPFERRNRTGNIDGYYFTPQTDDANRYAKEQEGSEVIPAFLSIENPYIPGESKVTKAMRDQYFKEMVEANDHMSDERAIQYAKDKMYYLNETGLPLSNAINGNGAAFQRIIKAGGYDGYQDGRHWVAFNANQVKSAFNLKPTKASPDIRFSLKESIDPDTAQAIDRTTTSRQEEGFADRMVNSISAEARARFRQGIINKYEGIERLTKEKAKKFGDQELLADVSSIAAALFSDRAAGVAASSFRNGVPVYEKGFTTVSDLDGKVKGLIPIFEPLMKYNDPYIFQMFQFYAGTKRGKRLTAEGREKLFTPEDIKRGQALEAQYPEFKQAFDEYQLYNQGLVKFMKDTGVISEKEAQVWTQNWDYIPFFRQMDGEETVGPRVFSAISGVAKPKKLKGGEAPLADFMETVVRNSRAAIEAGMKNVASQRVVRDVVALGQGKEVPANEAVGTDIVTVKENGLTKYYKVADPLLVESMKGLNLPQLPFLDILSKPAELLRNLVTKDPGFMLANLMRDSVQAWVTTGQKMTPIVDTFKQYGAALANMSPEARSLAQAGLFTGYDFAGDVKATAREVEKELRRRSGTNTPMEIALWPVTKVWEALEKGSTASDVATRAEVYKRVLKETGNEAEAMYQAMEVLNFSRRGNSAIIRVLTAMVPFMNARIQGLDVLYRAGFGEMASVNREMQQKAFMTRSLTILGLSAMYWALASDSEEYKTAEPEMRDNYWIMGNVRIPIPFEIGTVFKVFPERILEYWFGQDTGKDLKESIFRNLTSTLAFNPIPQAALPLIENVANYSFFTGQPIVGKGMEDVAPKFQATSGTSLLAQQVGEATGASPMKVDNLIRGYTGTLGTYAVMMIDSLMRGEGDPTKATMKAEQLPVIKRFFASEKGTGTISSYYDLKEQVQEATRTLNYLERTGNSQDLKAYYEEKGAKLMAIKPFIQAMDKNMTELRELRQSVLRSNMDPDRKREVLDNIRQAEVNLTSRIQLIKKQIS